MLDRDRVLAKLDELEGYERELRDTAPTRFEEYMENREKRRACERILQISVECVIDICHLFVAGLRLGLPAEEEDIFNKLAQARLLPPEVLEVLRRAMPYALSPVPISAHYAQRMTDQFPCLPWRPLRSWREQGLMAPSTGR